MHNKCKIVDSLKNLLFFVVQVAVTVVVAEASWCHDNDGNGAQWLIMAALKYQRHIYSKRALHFLAHFLASTHSDNAKFRPNFKSYGGKPVLKKNDSMTACSMYTRILLRERRGYQEITQIEIIPKELKLTGKRITYFITIVVSFIVKLISTLRGNVTECTR